MTANVARVTLTGYIMYFVNPHFASGAYHTLEGLLMLGFGLSLLRGRVLGARPGRRGDGRRAGDAGRRHAPRTQAAGRRRVAVAGPTGQSRQGIAGDVRMLGVDRVCASSRARDRLARTAGKDVR